jgi:hypothetical protein
MIFTCTRFHKDRDHDLRKAQERGFAGPPVRAEQFHPMKGRTDTCGGLR